MSKDYSSSVAPKERINISYVPKTDGEPSEVELPLNMLIVGDTGNTQETAPLDERQMVSIDKHSFNSVMAEAAISLNFAVPAKLKDDAKADEEMNISLEIKSLSALPGAAKPRCCVKDSRPTLFIPRKRCGEWNSACISRRTSVNRPLYSMRTASSASSRMRTCCTAAFGSTG